MLTEGRSQRALFNSLAVCMYSKSMHAFMMRTQPLAGTLPPENISDALCLMSSKDPNVMKQFPQLNFRLQKLSSSINEMKPYMKDRAKYAKELFPRYKGYYPYYYFFGNLKTDRELQITEGTLRWVTDGEFARLPMPVSAKHMILHYLKEGRFTDFLYAGITEEDGTAFVPMVEFEG